jgi:hypothetical protein
VSVAIELRDLAGDLVELPRRTMIDAAKMAKQVVQQAGEAIAGADGMKGKKRRGLKLRARDTIRGNSARETTIRVQGTVPAWIWANTGTRPHQIRRRKKGPMRKMTVHHPGTAGRGSWDALCQTIIDRTIVMFDAAVDEAVR